MYLYLIILLSCFYSSSSLILMTSKVLQTSQLNMIEDSDIVDEGFDDSLKIQHITFVSSNSLKIREVKVMKNNNDFLFQSKNAIIAVDFG